MSGGRVTRLLVCGVLFALLAPPAAAQTYPDPMKVGGDVVPAADPSILIKPRGTGEYDYFLYSTGNSRASVSLNRRDFKQLPAAVLPPALWWRDYNQFGDFWAPDVSFHDGKYWLYYSVSMPLKQKSAIGLATSPTGLPGTWVDSGGPILTTREADPDTDPNALDPSLFVDDDGSWWLVFGSYFGGIYIVELDRATGKVRAGAQPTSIAAATQIEGATMVKHGGAYYLFASYGDCCVSRTAYHVKVGRSSSRTGPFTDRGGAPMSGTGGTVVVKTHPDPPNQRIGSPGGQSIVYDPADQREKFVYHYYDHGLPRTNGDDRRLGINNLEWDAAGWPYLAPAARTGDVEVSEMEIGSEPGPGSGSVVDGWHVFAPGWVDRTFAVTDDSPYVLGVSARGRFGGGAWPILRLWVDGQVLEERTIDSTQWKLYRFDVARLTAGTHRVRFELANDYFGGNLEDDRNVYIDKVTASSSVNAEDMHVRGGPGGVSDGGWVIHEQGKVENSFDFSAANRYVLRVRAKGATGPGGWPLMRIQLDGVEVGQVRVDSLAWDYYEIETPVAPGERRLGVVVTNGSDGDPPTHGDLWVDTVSAAAGPAKCIFEGPTRPVGRNEDRC